MKSALKTAAIKTILSTIASTRAGRLMPSAAGQGVIFTLHHVRPKRVHAFEPNAHLEITPQFLETAILAAKAAGLIPVPLAELPDLLKTGNPKARYCAFTLDDGYRNNAKYAAPVFHKHGVPYTIFICAGFVERTRILWWETAADILEKAASITLDFGNGPELVETSNIQAKQSAYARIAVLVETLDENEAISRIGALAATHGINPLDYVERELMNETDLKKLAEDPLCALGGHTLTHCNLARVDDNRLQREIHNSCAKVSQYTGQTVNTFAYPYGWHHAAGPREFAATASVGITAAVTTVPNVLTAGGQSTGLPRVSLNGLYQKRRYVEALITGLPFRLMR